MSRDATAFSRRRMLATAAGAVGAAGTVGIAALACAPVGDLATSQRTRQPARFAFWSYGSTGAVGPIMEKVAQEYQKRFPDVTIDFTGVPSGQIQDKLVVALTSGSGPDIYYDSWRAFQRFMDNGWFLDITAEFGKRKYRQSDFYDVALKAHQIDGKQMGMPQGWGTSLFGMNLDIYQSAGVRLDPGFDEKWTQDDLIRMLKSVVKYDEEGRMAPHGGADDPILFHWLYSYGGDFLAPDMSKAATTTPEALAAAEWYAKVHTGDRVFMRDSVDKRSGIGFLMGNVAINGSGIPVDLPRWALLPFKVNVFLRPKAPKGHFARMYMDSYLIFKETKARDATVDFLFWLMDDGATLIEKEHGGINIPPYKKVAEEVFLKVQSPFSRKKWIDAAAQSKTDPKHPKWQPDLNTIYGKYAGQLRTGQASPREAMRNMANDVNAVLDEYRRQRGR